MGFLKQEYWRGLPFLSPGDLSDLGMEPMSPALQVDSLPLSHWGSHGSSQPHGLYSPRNFPGQNTGVGSHSFLQGIFSTQGSNPGLLHCSQILHQLSHQGSPRVPEWVASPFSIGSSGTRNQIRVSCIAGGFFTSWATREALLIIYYYLKKDHPQAWWLESIHISYPTVSLWVRGLSQLSWVLCRAALTLLAGVGVISKLD